MRSALGGALGLALAVACGGPERSGRDAVRDNTGDSAKVTLTITVSGQGSVSAPGRSVACAATCAEPLAAGTAVELFATPATGMQFTGWSGACSGAGGCTLTLAQDTRVGATFAPARAADPCTGLMPQLPPARTFVSPGDAIVGGCGGTTTDGVGTVYNFENTNGGGIHSSAGGVGGGNLIFVLASGFVTAPRNMVGHGEFSAFAPDGTFLSATDDYRSVATGEQANGGSIILSVRAAAGLEVVRFDERFAKTSSHVLADPFTAAYDHAVEILVDAQDRTLIVYVAAQGDVAGIPAGDYGARWFDTDGKPLTDWFDAGRASSIFYYFALTPLIGGGVALAEGSGDWVTIPSAAARVGPPPAGFVSGKAARIVLGGRAYAMTGTKPGTIDIVEPGGKACGTLAIGSDSYSIGKDGTVLTLANTVGPSGRTDTCTTTYYPQVLK